VTDGLGGNAAGALNALIPVPASGGGRRPCARGLSIRTSLFPYSTVAGAPALVDSHDALPVFEATNVDNRACGQGASNQGPSICIRVLSSCASVRVPLTDTLDSHLTRTSSSRPYRISSGHLNTRIFRREDVAVSQTSYNQNNISE